MRLIHYSAEPMPPLTDPRQSSGRRIGKPSHGLWVSVESRHNDGWRHWCEDENFGLDRLTHASEIVLKPKAKPLWIKTAAAVQSLALRYPRQTDDVAYVSEIDAVDWSAVMREWPAIIIAPYQWRCRVDVMWYYGWDCASGVIWDISIIEAVRPAPEFARPQEKAA
jgi:hypothetical protein